MKILNHFSVVFVLETQPGSAAALCAPAPRLHSRHNALPTKGHT